LELKVAKSVVTALSNWFLDLTVEASATRGAETHTIGLKKPSARLVVPRLVSRSMMAIVFFIVRELSLAGCVGTILVL
jgi:hypothetical protein